jgi:hypothetical protein
MSSSRRLMKAAAKVMLPGEQAEVAVVASTARIGWPDPTVQAFRVPAAADVVLLVTSHRLLLLETLSGYHAGEPILGVGPHNLLALEVEMTPPLSAAISIQFLDGSVAELTTTSLASVPALKHAFARLLPSLDSPVL